MFALDSTGTVTYVCDLYGLTEDQAHFASPEFARGVIEGINRFCSRTAVPE